MTINKQGKNVGFELRDYEINKKGGKSVNYSSCKKCYVNIAEYYSDYKNITIDNIFCQVSGQYYNPSGGTMIRSSEISYTYDSSIGQLVVALGATDQSGGWFFYGRGIFNIAIIR